MAAYYPPNTSASTGAISAHRPAWGHPETVDPDAGEEMEDVEVDELKSEDELDEDMPYQRTPGETALPPARVHHIMLAEAAIGTLAISPDSLFLISVAAEEFIKRMTEAAHRQARAQQRTQVTYRDMSLTTQQYQEFAFLQDTIPEPMSLEDALRLRGEKAQAELDEDPATATIVPSSSSLSAFVPIAPLPKTKPARRTTTGKERANGSTANSSRKRGMTDDDDDFAAHSSDGAFHGRSARRCAIAAGSSATANDAHSSAPPARESAPRLRTRASTQSASVSNSSSPFTTQPLPPFSSAPMEDVVPDLPAAPAATRSASGTPSDFAPPPRTNGNRVSHPPDLPHGRTIYSQRPE